MKMKEKSILFFCFILQVTKIPIASSVCYVCNTVNIKIFADPVQVHTIV